VLVSILQASTWVNIFTNLSGTYGVTAASLTCSSNHLVARSGQAPVSLFKLYVQQALSRFDVLVLALVTAAWAF